MALAVLSLDQAGLELGDLPASDSQVLRLKGFATMPGNTNNIEAETNYLVSRALCALSPVMICIYSSGLFWKLDRQPRELFLMRLAFG